ncbi:hypothetical protein EVAR_14143_1 [Eumeta japonica]|uniref:Uncharacterized protein n=1 Tax=Eumeta variegata TaxID=151549 RepID=A0A4C1UF98_EUMVA|nr:hypothetical protein EVAR_14143_1 [Eumeta japonica]
MDSDNNREKVTRNMDERWVKCPSKTFPNKYYYFNPYTGSAVWDLNDIKPSYVANHLRSQYSQYDNFSSTNSFFPPFPPYFNGIPYGNGFPLAPFWINQPVCMMPVPVPIQLREEIDFGVQATLVPLSSRFRNDHLEDLTNNESSADMVNISKNNREDMKVMCNQVEQENVTNVSYKTDKNVNFLT